MHKMHKSELQKHSSQGAFYSAFTLGTVPQYHAFYSWNSTTIVVILRFAQQRKIALKIFLEGADYLDYFYPLTTTQVNFI
jgi:hypothetical protein